MIWHYKGRCKTCNKGIGWLKDRGWQHVGSSTSCTNLIPDKGSVNK